MRFWNHVSVDNLNINVIKQVVKVVSFLSVHLNLSCFILWLVVMTLLDKMVFDDSATTCSCQNFTITTLNEQTVSSQR